MKHIFYLIGIAFMIHESIWIISPISQTKKSKKLHEEKKNNEDKKVWDEYSEDFKYLIITRGLPSLLFTIWFFVGLLTFNWFSFALILLFNFAIILPISKLFRFSIAYTIFHWINSIIGFAFGAFVIINSYHLHIDVYKLFIGLF